MNEKNAQVFETLSRDTEFMNRLGQMESYEEIANALNEAGAEVTADEVEKLLAMAEKSNVNGELDTEDLDAVSGGVLGTFWISILAKLWWRR